MASPIIRRERGSSAPPERPPIWIKGSQRPQFNLAAFSAYAYMIARDTSGPLLDRLGTSTGHLQDKVASGAWVIPAARLGRIEPFVPSHQGVARCVGSVVQTLHDAALIARPPKIEEAADPRLVALWRTQGFRPRPAAADMQRDRLTADPELAALRAEGTFRPRRPVRSLIDAPADAEIFEAAITTADQRDADQSLTPGSELAAALPGSIGVEAIIEARTEAGLTSVVTPDETPLSTQPPANAEAQMQDETDTLSAIRMMINSEDAVSPTQVKVTAPADPRLAEPPLQRAPVASVDAGVTDKTAPRPPREWPAWTRRVAAMAARQARRGGAFAGFWFGKGAAQVIGWSTVVLALPYGAVKATIAHLDGQDLKDLLQEA